MSKAKKFIELMYPKAMWYEEVFRFYQRAGDTEIEEFESLVSKGNEKEALNLVKRVLGIK